MNFYNRFVGDFQRDTGHLSCAEMGVYDRLLDHYYATEIPLPASLEACCRIARAMSKDERKAVDAVLAQFFVSTEKGYTQKRADEELEKAKPKIAAAKTNGAKGGRPRKNPDQTQEKPTGFPLANPAETQVETSPEPEPYKPTELTHRVENSTIVGDSTLAGRVCAELKKLKIQGLNPAHPMLLALLDAGATLEQFTCAAETATVKKLAYIIGMVKGQREQAAAEAAGLAKGKLKVVDTAWRKDDNAIVRKAQELKIGTQGKTRDQLLSAIDAKQEQIDREAARGEKAA